MIWAKSLTISATPTRSMLISGGLVGQEKWMAMDTSGIACCETNVEVGIEIRLIDKTAENDALLRSESLPLHRSINTLSCCKAIEDEKTCAETSQLAEPRSTSRVAATSNLSLSLYSIDRSNKSDNLREK